MISFQRVKVPGGWIYFYAASVYGFGVFVPKPPKKATKKKEGTS